MEDSEVNRLLRENEWLKTDRLEELRLRVSLQERIKELEAQLESPWSKLLRALGSNRVEPVVLRNT